MVLILFDRCSGGWHDGWVYDFAGCGIVFRCSCELGFVKHATPISKWARSYRKETKRKFDFRALGTQTGHSAMKRKPRMSQGLPPEGAWRQKVHPFFIEMMEQYKQIEHLYRSGSKEDQAKAQRWARNPPENLLRRARELGEQFRREGGVQREIAGKILDLDLEDPATVKEPSDEQYMLSWLSWHKYRKTWRQLQYERNRGSWRASQQILAVLRDYEKWKFNKLDPNAMRFKADRLHFNLMAFGLEFGLDKLTLNELADCFDALCACGKEPHDPDNLRKLRKSILKSLERLDAKTAALRPEKS